MATHEQRAQMLSRYSDEQIAARTMIQEVDGEPPDGEQAVAHVLVNRKASGRWGHTYGSVCSAPWQFSAWWAGDPGDVANFERSLNLAEDDPDIVKMLGILKAAETEDDPTGGATHYYNPKKCAEPAWVKGKPEQGVPPATLCGQFGHQLFYRNVR